MTPAKYKSIRRKIGTQQEVANLLGVDRGTVIRREGDRLPITKEAELALLYLAFFRPKQAE